jgi:hypothetical protein
LTRLRNLLGSPRADPTIEIKPLYLAAKDLRISVKPRWKRLRDRSGLRVHVVEIMPRELLGTISALTLPLTVK